MKESLWPCEIELTLNWRKWGWRRERRREGEGGRRRSTTTTGGRGWGGRTTTRGGGVRRETLWSIVGFCFPKLEEAYMPGLSECFHQPSIGTLNYFPCMLEYKSVGSLLLWFHHRAYNFIHYSLMERSARVTLGDILSLWKYLGTHLTVLQAVVIEFQCWRRTLSYWIV